MNLQWGELQLFISGLKCIFIHKLLCVDNLWLWVCHGQNLWLVYKCTSESGFWCIKRADLQMKGFKNLNHFERTSFLDYIFAHIHFWWLYTLLYKWDLWLVSLPNGWCLSPASLLREDWSQETALTFKTWNLSQDLSLLELERFIEAESEQ